MSNRGFVDRLSEEFTGSPRTVRYPAATGTVTPDANASTHQIMMVGNLTLAAPAGSPLIGEVLNLVLIQDGTGSRTVAFNAIYRNSPTLSAGAPNARVMLEYKWDGVSWQYVGKSGLVFA